MKFLGTLLLGLALAIGASTAAAPPAFAHMGYGIEYPRGCKLVFTTVRVNGVDVVLRRVQCPKDAPRSASPTS